MGNHDMEGFKLPSSSDESPVLSTKNRLFWYLKGFSIKGPLSMEDINNLVRNGTIKTETFISTKKWGGWFPIFKLTGKSDNTKTYVIDNLLSKEEASYLLEYAHSKEKMFVPGRIYESGVLKVSSDRKSQRIELDSKIKNIFKDNLKSILPEVCAKLGIGYPEEWEFDSDITLYKDGDYIKSHNDNGSFQLSRRFLSVVYYFFEQPKEFTGGELLIQRWRGYDEIKKITPTNNSAVFLSSGCWHEVLPVYCKSKNFLKNRMTVNIWVTKKGP